MFLSIPAIFDFIQQEDKALSHQFLVKNIADLLLLF